jgi:hypothetical protein
VGICVFRQNEKRDSITMKIVPKYGIVGFFDILGYRNLMLNNKIESTAKIFLEIIDKLPSFVRYRVMKSILHPNAREIAGEILRTYP